MRNEYVVAYDIADEKRLRRVHRCMLGYGDPVQYSVFRCHLSRQERVLMLAALAEIIHQEADQVMIVDLGPSEGQAPDRVEFLGKPSPPVLRGVIVI